MRAFGLLLVLIAISAVSAYDEEDDVLVLHESDFSKAIEEFDFIMVEFYAPWCGHCKKLTPEYAAAAGQLKQKGGEKKIALAKVDTTVEKSLGELFEVKGYPTLLFFSKAKGVKPVSYEGPRTTAEIVAYMNKSSGPASQLVRTLEELQKITTSVDDVPVVVFFGVDPSDSEYSLYEGVAAVSEGAQFFHTFDVAAREHFKLAHNQRVVLFKNFDSKKNVYESHPLEAEALLQFIERSSVPSVIPFNDKAIQLIFQKSNPALILFLDDSEESVKAFEEFSAAASILSDKIKFTYSKPNDASGLFTRLAEYVGADQNNLPCVMLISPSQEMAKFKFTSALTADNFKTFVNDFIAGSLTRYLKSEELPETNDKPVKIIVGKNFKDLVLKSGKDVLVYFYAPWCGHCKTLAPIYEELAQKLSKNTNLVLGKCDATANEVEGVDIESFPTLFFWKNGQKDKMAFTGERDLEGIQNFLKENVSHKWVEGHAETDL